MKKSNPIWFILSLTLIAAYISFPRQLQLNFSVGKFKIDKTISGENLDLRIGPFDFKRPIDVKRGLDLQGGTHLIFQAQVNDLPDADRVTSLESVKQNIERRVNFYGVTEASVQSSVVNNDYRLLVDLPGVKDINQAIDLIGQTAVLQFWEENPDKEAASKSGELYLQTDLTGKDLKRAAVTFDQNTSQPVVSLEFNGDGAKKFAEITKRNLKKIVPIVLDGVPVSTPSVDEPILDGNAIIRGSFTVEEAKKLAIQLNAGALPVSIKLIEQRNIGATLGSESVNKSLRAGVIGLGLVMLFMIAYYGRLGLLAAIALVVYGLLTLALYKLIPVTLTLPGIAGFILSVGMAVDSNILIFERMKEETRLGKPVKIAMELGFGRAWDSIRDANVCTLITAFILFNPMGWSFLNVSGMVRGFALTLALGIFVSLFTGIVVTRTLIRTFYK